MSGRLFSFARFAAHLCRNVSAIGAVFFAVRFTWLAGADSIASARERLEAAGENQASLTDEPDTPRTKRVDPEKVAKSLGEGPSVIQPLAERAPASSPTPALRRILVDLGPERSEVFLDGRLVGHTPYLGQVSCTAGARLRIEVLPTRGAPIKRIVVCQGTNLVAAREPNP